MKRRNSLSNIQGTMHRSQRQRDPLYDVAKGIGIILVVAGHLGTSLFLWSSQFIYTFHMPLFFVLSGVFFSAHNSFRTFALKKVNSLIIPFLFYYSLTSICIPVVLHYYLGIDLLYFEKKSISEYLFSFFTSEIFVNPPTWFLLSLFEVFIFMYFIVHVAKDSIIKIIATSGIIGVLGCFLAYFNTNIPCYMDTSFTVLPFFSFGYIIFRRTQIGYNILYSKNSKKFSIIMVLAIVVFLLLTKYVFCDYRINYYNHILFIYPMGIMGFTLVMYLSKKMGNNRYFRFLGENSLTVLCTHFLIIEFLQRSILYFYPLPLGIENKFFAICVLVVTLLLEFYVVIPFVNRYIPYISSKKNIFKV